MKFKAEDLINQAIKRHSPHISVGCSFGKDSMAVLHMALKIKPNIKVIFENTGVEFPETIQYKERILREWKLNLHETKPIMDFWDCVDKYGLPKCRKQKGKGSNSPKCCFYLKEEPANILQKSLKVNTTFTGLQSCESRSRHLIALRYDNQKSLYMEKEHNGDIIEFCAQRWYTKSTGIWNYHPIMHWSTYEVWKYTLENKIPINPAYTLWDINGKIHNDPSISLSKKGYLILDGIPALYNRCGCLPCTAYLDWEKKLSKSHIQLYRHLKKLQHPTQTTLKGGGGK